MGPTRMKTISDSCECVECNVTFRDHFNLSQHLKTRKHSQLAKMYACSHCRRSFQSVYTLRRHLNLLHANRNVSRKSDVQCPLCSTSMYKLLIYDHFEEDHGIKLEYEKREFDTLGLFESWKSDFEKETVSRFVLYATNHLADGSVKRTYNCQRSGKSRIKPLEQRVHKPRSKGSAKVNGFCPARIIIHANQNGEEVNVEVCTTHVGHRNDLGSVDLRFDDRALLASMIAEGLPFEEILERVRNSMSSSNLDRIHLTTRKDLHNIAKEFKLTKCDTMKRIEEHFGLKLDEELDDVLPSIEGESVRNRKSPVPLTLTDLPECTVVFDTDPIASSNVYVVGADSGRVTVSDCKTSHEVEGSQTFFTEVNPSSSKNCKEQGDQVSVKGLQSPGLYVREEIVLSASGADITGQAGYMELESNLIDVIEDDAVVLIVQSDAGDNITT